MAKVKPSLIEQTGTIGDRVFYTRFGKQFSRSKATSFTDNKSEAQLRQRALFKAMQHTSSILGSVIQRGLAKEAHAHGHVENNEFAKINKQCFTYEDGTVHIDYPRLILSTGPIARVDFTNCHVDGLHVELQFEPCSSAAHSNPDDVVFIYAVEFQTEVCQLVACVERRAASVAFDLPDLSDEIASNCMNKPRGKQANRTNALTHSHDNTINLLGSDVTSSRHSNQACLRSTSVTFHLYAIVEAANTACVSTLSPDEKKADKNHRNINRRVSPSVFIGTITVGSAN